MYACIPGPVGDGVDDPVGDVVDAGEPDDDDDDVKDGEPVDDVDPESVVMETAGASEKVLVGW